MVPVHIYYNVPQNSILLNKIGPRPPGSEQLKKTLRGVGEGGGVGGLNTECP